MYTNDVFVDKYKHYKLRKENKWKKKEWHKIEDKNDLPWEDGVYEFRDKDGEIEEVCILWDDNDDCNIGWEYYDAWRNLTTKEIK